MKNKFILILYKVEKENGSIIDPDLIISKKYKVLEFSNEYDNGSTNNRDLRNEPIYLYHSNGWMATAMRKSNLWGSVIGNNLYTNSFFILEHLKNLK